MMAEVYTCNLCNMRIRDEDPDARAVYLATTPHFTFLPLKDTRAQGAHLCGKCREGLIPACRQELSHDDPPPLRSQPAGRVAERS